MPQNGQFECFQSAAQILGKHGQVIRRALPLDPQDEAPLLAAEMDVLGHDRVYEESLRAVAALLGQA